MRSYISKRLSYRSRISVLAQPLDGVGEVEIDAQAGRRRRRVPRRTPAWRRARRCRAGTGCRSSGTCARGSSRARPRGSVRPALVAGYFRNPDAPVVAERFGHQGQLRLVGARDRDARRVDLRVARVAERRAALVRAPDRGRVARPSRWSRGRRRCRIRRWPGRPRRPRCDEIAPGDHVAHDDAAGAAVDDDDVLHLVAGVHRHLAEADLPLERLVGAEEELLPGLAARVEGPRHLRAAERAVREHAGVLARERHALRDALVDDVDRQLGQPVDVGLARPEVAALDRVVEQAPHANRRRSGSSSRR